MTTLAAAAARLLGGTLDHAQTLHGGDLSVIEKVTLLDGRMAVVKTGAGPRTEAAMLEAIAASGAPAPAVLAVTDRMLVLEFIEAPGRPGNAWPHLGQTLATLHRTTGPRYGWAANYAFSHIAIDNRWADDWPGFYADRRLRVHLSELPSPLARRVEALARDLPNRLPKHPARSLLHGDCWGGNVLVHGTRIAALIDPACHFGHAEIDLAMLSLFDHPSDAFIEAYGPLEPGHADRHPIYQLWPALVHFRLFGAGYRRLVENLLAVAGV